MRITFPDSKPNSILVEFAPELFSQFVAEELSLIATLNSADQLDWLHVDKGVVFDSHRLLIPVSAFQVEPNGVAVWEFHADYSPNFRQSKECFRTVEQYLAAIKSAYATS